MLQAYRPSSCLYGQIGNGAKGALFVPAEIERPLPFLSAPTIRQGISQHLAHYEPASLQTNVRSGESHLRRLRQR